MKTCGNCQTQFPEEGRRWFSLLIVFENGTAEEADLCSVACLEAAVAYEKTDAEFVAITEAIGD